MKDNHNGLCIEPEDGDDDREDEGYDARCLQINPQYVVLICTKSLPTEGL